MSTIISRILKIADFKGVSANKLTTMLDLSGTYFYKQKTNDGNVGSHILMKIVDIYTDINPTWLLTGRGEMLREVGKSGEGRTTPAYPEEGKDADVIGRLQRRVAELEEDKRRLQREVDSLHEMLAGYKKNGLAAVQKKIG